MPLLAVLRKHLLCIKHGLCKVSALQFLYLPYAYFVQQEVRTRNIGNKQDNNLQSTCFAQGKKASPLQKLKHSKGKRLVV